MIYEIFYENEGKSHAPHRGHGDKSAAVPVVENVGKVPAAQGIPVDEEVCHARIAPHNVARTGIVAVHLEEQGVMPVVKGARVVLCNRISPGNLQANPVAEEFFCVFVLDGLQ